MKVIVIYHKDPSSRTIHIFDNDGREAVIRPHEVPHLIKLLKKARKDPGIHPSELNHL